MVNQDETFSNVTQVPVSDKRPKIPPNIWFPVMMDFTEAEQYVKREKYKLEFMLLGVDENNAKELIELVTERAKIHPFSIDTLLGTIKVSLAQGLSLVKTVDRFSKQFPS